MKFYKLFLKLTFIFTILIVSKLATAGSISIYGNDGTYSWGTINK